MLTFSVVQGIHAATPTVEAVIDSVQILVGEQTGMHLSAFVKPGQKVVFPQFKEQQPLGAVEVVNLPVVDTTKADDGFIKVTEHLTLTAWEDSVCYIPKQTIRVDGKPYDTKPLALKVLTCEVDTVHPNQFFGPKDVQDNPFEWSEWLSILCVAIVAMVLFVLSLLAYMRLKNGKPIKLKVKIVKRIPPHQKALTTIESLKAENRGTAVEDTTVALNRQKDYYTKLTDALRLYMEERFGFNAREMTSGEIIAQLKQLPDADIQELTGLFETADLVKFAKYQVAMNENDHNLINAVTFINNTKQENVPTEEKIEPTVTEKERHDIRLRRVLKWAMTIMTIIIVALVTYLCWQLWDLRG